MPTEQSTATATATSRRSFLTRTAIGGALVIVGALVAPATGLLPSLPAGAETLVDPDLAAFAIPLELAAVLAYQAALDSGTLDATWTATVSKIQTGHQTVVTSLTTLLPTDATPPVASTEFSAPIVKAIQGAAAQEAVLASLSGMEDTLSATYLLALASIADPVTANVVSQALASEAQSAAALGRAAGTPIATLTPAVATTTTGLEPGELADAPPPATTTTTTGN